MLETVEDRVSSMESRGLSLESRETRLSRICKNSKGFGGNDLFLEERIIEYCSHLQKSTSVSRRSLSHENFRPNDSGLNMFFFLRQLVLKTEVDHGNLPVKVDNPLHTSEPFAKLLK